MRISQLITHLEEVHNECGDLVVYVSRDSEGNRFHYFDGISVGYMDDNLEYSEEKDYQNAVILWP